MNIIKRWHPELIGLIIGALATRFWSLFSPNAVVFDEVYFKAFAAHYLDGNYYFDIHPPLGKLLLAGFARILNLSPETMLSGTALSLRILPALAGAILVPLTWGILRRLGASRAFAFIGAFLVLFDNALLVESRFILMDSMLLLFGLGGIYLYLVARDSKSSWRWLWLALSIVSASAAMSIKWTGVSSLAIIGLLWLWDQPHRHISLLRRISELFVIAAIPLALYASVFFVHFHLLPKSGDGDAFMSPKFQSTLVGSPTYDGSVKISFIDKFIELNKEMFLANQTLTASHPYGSRWYTWPLEQRPIYYWQGEMQADNRQGNIYLLGNPIVWWGIWIAIIAGLMYTWIFSIKLRPSTLAALALAGTAYLINLLPFVAVARVMFLYHYFFSLFFSIIFALMLWNDLATDKKNHQLKSINHKRIYLGILTAVLAGFIFFSPISYGTPLNPSELQARMWLQTWR